MLHDTPKKLNAQLLFRKHELFTNDTSRLYIKSIADIA